MDDRQLNPLKTGVVFVGPGQIMDPGIMKLPHHSGAARPPLMETARAEKWSRTWHGEPSGGLWGAICGRLLVRFRQRPSRADWGYMSQPDFERQLRRDMLRHGARRIL